MLTIVPCPVCNRLDSELYLDGDDDEISLASVGSSRTLLSHGRILRCVLCGLAYRSFRPKGDQLAQLYRAADDSTYEAEMPNRWKTALRHKQIVEHGPYLPNGLAPRYRLRLRFLLAGNDRCRLEWGWHRAFRIAVLASKQAPRCIYTAFSNVRCKMRLLSKDYDLVTLWDVLEHVTDPVEFLQLAASHLRIGGYLALNVPRVDSPVARVLGSRWPLLLAEHLNYFTIPSLRICGKAAGLRLIEYRVNGPQRSPLATSSSVQHSIEIPGSALLSEGARMDLGRFVNGLIPGVARRDLCQSFKKTIG